MAMSFLNSVAGTAGNMIDITGNAGVRGNTNPTTTGYNYGTVGLARDGNLNVGMYGRAFVAKNSATNVGAFGIARNTGSSPVEIGGFFGLYGSSAAAPTLVSAGLVASNGVSTSPIFLARDADTTALAIIDGGNVGIGTSSPDSLLEVIGTSSGRTFFAMDTLSSSGNLIIESLIKR